MSANFKIFLHRLCNGAEWSGCARCSYHHYRCSGPKYDGATRSSRKRTSRLSQSCDVIGRHTVQAAAGQGGLPPLIWTCPVSCSIRLEPGPPPFAQRRSTRQTRGSRAAGPARTAAARTAAQTPLSLSTSVR